MNYGFFLRDEKHMLPWIEYKQCTSTSRNQKITHKKTTRIRKIISIYFLFVSVHEQSQWSIEAKLVCASRILTFWFAFYCLRFSNKWKVRKNYVIHKHNKFFVFLFIRCFDRNCAVCTHPQHSKLEEERPGDDDMKGNKNGFHK